MTSEELNKLKLKEIAISSIIESIISDRLPTESEISENCEKYCKLLYPNMTKEDVLEINKMLNERFHFKLDVGTLIYDEEIEPWFKEYKENNPCPYFDRYKEYLKKDKNFNQKAIDVLDNEVLDDLMDQLGNPNKNFNPRRGLVMGDVQSGKTSTYIGLICKAADAGYKAIIVLTGTVECLRQQTQKRLDLGFVGFNSNHMTQIDNDDYWIGVGRYSKRRGVVLTSQSSDFVTSTAKNLGFSLSNFNDTVLFVVKKNVSVLSRLLKWLKDLNGSNGKIDYPLLIIDDESDNASINTNPNDGDTDPTKINNLIRKLLKMFTKNNYVGFTATPFANVFINPEIYEDLFPKDFIYELKSPTGYIGASDIFLDESKYRKSLYKNEDCEEVLPLKHKKYTEFKKLPKSLKDAIYSYFITNVIRDIRGDNLEHRGMLINISRFTTPQEKIHETVELFVNELISKVKLYSKEKNYDLSIYKDMKDVYSSYYKDIDIDFNDIWEKLYDSNSRIECITVNSNSKMINYDDYKDIGARLIVIGGLSLSRGITIEGLCISYLYRTSKVYDVLLQMGRWFGYRKNYDDLFRIWMPQDMMEWYKEITIAVEELKIDLERMKNLRQKPSDFGIRIRNDKTGLKITARNKMLTSADYEVKKSMFGDFDDTGIISKDININKKNFLMIKNMLESLKNKGYVSSRTYNDKLIWKDIPKEYIIKILSEFVIDKGNYRFNKDSYISFLNSCPYQELDLFDIAIIEGDRNENNLKNKSINFLDNIIVRPEKNFSLTETGISINREKALLVNPIDTSYGLDKTRKEQAEAKHRKYQLAIYPNKDPKNIHVSAKTYLRISNRKPLLMIYLLDLKTKTRSELDEDIKPELVEFKQKLDENGVIPIGIALAIPEYTNKHSEYINYKINLVEQKNILMNEEEDLYDEIL